MSYTYILANVSQDNGLILAQVSPKTPKQSINRPKAHKG